MIPITSSRREPAEGRFYEWVAPQAARAERKRIKREGRKQARKLARRLGVPPDMADQQFEIGYAEGVTTEELEQARIASQSISDVESTAKAARERMDRYKVMVT